MLVKFPIEKMSLVEKLSMMEALWENLSQDESQVESPEWHESALREAELLVKSGKAKFSSWETAKARVRRKAGKRS